MFLYLYIANNSKNLVLLRKIFEKFNLLQGYYLCKCKRINLIMAAVSQKDIVKIIKASTSNIGVIVDSLAKNISKVTGTENAKALESKVEEFEKVCGILNTYIKSMNAVLASIPKLQFPVAKMKAITAGLNAVTGVIEAFVDAMNNGKLSAINEQTVEQTNKVVKVFQSIATIFGAITSIIGKALLVLALGLVVKLAIYAVVAIASSIERFKKVNISKKAVQNIQALKDAIDAIYSIMKTMIKLIPLSVISVIGAVAIILFVLQLIAVVFIVNLLIKVTKPITNSAAKGISQLKGVFKALLGVSGAIIFFALVAPIAAIAMVLIILPFLVIVIGFFVILAIVTFLSGKLSSFARNRVILITINILAIAAMFIIMCLAIFLAYLAGEIIQKAGVLEKVLAGFIAIGLMFAAIITIGKWVSKSAKHLIGVRRALPSLLQILVLMGLVCIAIIIIGGLGYLIAEYDLGTYAALGLGAIVVVLGVMTGVAAALGKVSKIIAQSSKAILPLIQLLGLMALVAIAIIAFAFLGIFIEANLSSIVTGLVAIIIVIAILTVIGIALNFAAQILAATSAAVVPLLIVLGLMVGVAVAIIAFALTGMFLAEHLDATILGFVAIIAVTVIVIVLSLLVVAAAGPATMGAAAMAPLLIVLGLFVAAAVAIIVFALTGMLLEENLGYAVGGLMAIIVVSLIIIVLGAILAVLAPILAFVTMAAIPLLVVLGLFVAAALAIVVFALTAMFLEKNLGYAIAGFVAIIVVSALMIAVGLALAVLAPILATITVVMTPLLIVLGLFVAAALAIVLFAIMGEFLMANLTFALVGFAAIAAVVIAMIALGVLLGVAIGPLVLATVGGVFLLAAMALLLAVEALLVIFAETDLSPMVDVILGNLGWLSVIVLATVVLGAVFLAGIVACALIIAGAPLFIIAIGLLIAVEAILIEFASFELELGKITGNLLVISAVGAELLLMSVAMIAIAAGCLILTALIAPLLAAIAEVTLAAQSVETLGKLEIKEKQVTKNINSISVFWDAFKELMGKFSIKDLLTFDNAEDLTRMMKRVANSVKSIAESISEISKIQIESGAAISVVNNVFEVVVELAKKLKELLNGELADSPLFEVPEKGFWAFFKKNKKPTAKDKLNNVTKILITIKNIGDSLLEIEKYNFTEENKKVMTDTLDTIFSVIETLATKIENILENTNVFNDKIVQKSTWWGGKKEVKEENPNIEKLDNVSKICEVLNAITSSLNNIQHFELDKDKITDRVTVIFDFIQTLGEKIQACLSNTTMFDNQIIETSTWWGGTETEEKRPLVLDRIDAVTQITSCLEKMVNSLNGIQKLNVNESLITNKLDSVFGFILTIGNHIKANMDNFHLFDDKVEWEWIDESSWFKEGGHWEKKVTENQLAKNIAGYEQVLSTVIKMVESFEGLSKLEITPDIRSKVEGNLNEMFTFGMNVVNAIDSFLAIETKEAKGGFGNFLKVQEVTEAGKKSVGYIIKEHGKEYNESLESLSKLIDTIKTVLESIKKIDEIKFTEKVKKSIVDKINLLFTSVEEIMTKINEGFAKLNGSTGVNIANSAVLDNVTASIDQLVEVANRFNDIDLDKFKKSKPQIINFLRDLSKIHIKADNGIESAVKTVKDIDEILRKDGTTMFDKSPLDVKIEFLKNLNDRVNAINLTKFNNVKKAIVTALTELSKININPANGVVRTTLSIYSLLNLLNNGKILKTPITSVRLSYLERLTKVIKSMAAVTPEEISRSKQLLADQMAYLNKINSTDITKLKTTAKMLESMAKLSASIRGNFQGLASSLNEDIMPLLEKLKELLNELPDKINSGLSNNASQISGAIEDSSNKQLAAAGVSTTSKEDLRSSVMKELNLTGNYEELSTEDKKKVDDKAKAQEAAQTQRVATQTAKSNHDVQKAINLIVDAVYGIGGFEKGGKQGVAVVNVK